MANYQQDTINFEDAGLLDTGVAQNEQTLPLTNSQYDSAAENQEPRVSGAENEALTSDPVIPESRNQSSQPVQQPVGESDFLLPENEIEFSSSEQDSSESIILPNRELNNQNNDWLTILLLSALVLFASVRMAYPKYLSTLFQSVFNYSTSFRMFQEKNYSLLHGAFRLEMFFYIIFSIFLFQIFRYLNVSLPYENAGLFFYSLGIVLVYFLGKKLVYKLVGNIVEGTDETNEYLFNMDNVNRVTGLVLLPVIALVAFYPFENSTTPLVTGIILAAVLYFLLLFRGFTILLKKQFSIFYLFLYFCTLEILPLVLLYKIVAL